MRRYVQIGAGVLLILAALSACGGTQPEPQTESGTGVTLQLKSSAFQDQGTIPQRFTCDGEDVSPPLSWSEPPAGTQSLVLILDDPDAPGRTWDHWLLFNMPATLRSLPEGVPADGAVAGIGTHGTNSGNHLGYGGPCPPKGTTHRYFFKLYALDTTLDLKAGAGKGEIEKAMKGHVLAEAQLMGRYGR
jgi:Raf kinase inhibitor-like YbhB/YbcL family protein